MKGKKDIDAKTLIDELVFAELYILSKYLPACIGKASTCSHKKFNDISGDCEIFKLLL